MLSLKVPPPPPWPHIAKIKKEKEEEEDEGPSQTPPLDQDVTITPGTHEDLSEEEEEEGVEGEEEVKGKTIQKLSEVVNKIRIPKIEHDWKTCISEIENVINLQPTQDEYNDTVTRQNIEKYKDRLGRDLYECKVNLQKQDEDDKYKEQKRREKAQLLFLSQYLEKSMEDAGLTDSAICKARHAQKNILQKLNSVRSDLDNFISGVKPENQNNISL